MEGGCTSYKRQYRTFLAFMATSGRLCGTQHSQKVGEFGNSVLTITTVFSPQHNYHKPCKESYSFAYFRNLSHPFFSPFQKIEFYFRIAIFAISILFVAFLRVFLARFLMELL